MNRSHKESVRGEPEKPIKFLGEDSSLALYLKDIGKTKNLTMEEEADLALRIRQGDRKALNRLVSANLKFVVSVCRNYQNQGLPFPDLINEGNLGLIRAARRFDESKQFKFISYAVWWIRQAILQALAEQSRIITVPLNRVGTIHKIARTSIKMEQKLGRTPTSAEIAEELLLDEKDVNENLRLSSNAMSLDAPMATDEESNFIDILKDESAESPDERVVNSGLKREIGQVLGTLDAKEEEVVKLYFGIGMETSHTLEEIGLRFNLTRERVRQIKEKALKSLKRSSRSRNLASGHI